VLPSATYTDLVVVTSMGEIPIHLYNAQAPLSVNNVAQYVNEGFYDGSDGLGQTIIHRVEVDFVIQGGGDTPDGVHKQTHAPIVNEALITGLLNLRGTVALARTADPDSATSQFFVNLKDSPGLDPNPENPSGYAVFGEVTGDGMTVVDRIALVAVDGSQPTTTIPITSVQPVDSP
jgi:cyclophilin family peptidyl-prolyl cis-trans isomerase